MVSIDDWDFPAIQKGTDNSSQYASIHLSTLSFDPSNVYRVYSTRWEVLAEICKEYLMFALTNRTNHEIERSYIL